MAMDEPQYDQNGELRRRREDYSRCRFCKRLFLHEYADRDPVTGAYMCPDGCEPTFNQPAYESPFQD